MITWYLHVKKLVLHLKKSYATYANRYDCSESIIPEFWSAFLTQLVHSPSGVSMSARS
jgi:hypothetical protein